MIGLGSEKSRNFATKIVVYVVFVGLLCILVSVLGVLVGVLGVLISVPIISGLCIETLN